MESGERPIKGAILCITILIQKKLDYQARKAIRSTPQLLVTPPAIKSMSSGKTTETEAGRCSTKCQQMKEIVGLPVRLGIFF